MDNAISELIRQKIISDIRSYGGMVEILLNPNLKIIINKELEVTVYKKMIVTCIKCDGDGYDAYDGIGYPCSKCNGLKRIPTFIRQ